MRSVKLKHQLYSIKEMPDCNGGGMGNGRNNIDRKANKRLRFVGESL